MRSSWQRYGHTDPSAVAEDGYLVRQGVRMLVETDPELELTAFGPVNLVGAVP